MVLFRTGGVSFLRPVCSGLNIGFFISAEVVELVDTLS